MSRITFSAESAPPDAVARAVRVLACVLTMHGGAALADGTPVARFDVVQPRAFGYQLGDEFERRVALNLVAPYRLILESIPPEGRLNRWIALNGVDVDEGRVGNERQYDIRFRYQVINVDEAFSDVGIPDHELRIGDGAEELGLFIRPSRTTVARLTDGTGGALLPDQPPRTRATGIVPLLVSGLVLVLSLAGLAITRWGLPYRHATRPFARLHRRLKRSTQGAWDDAAYRRHLKDIHEAFNETAGRTVFAETLDGFFEQRRPFKRLEPSIRGYFAHSTAVFFRSESAGERFSRDELLRLVDRCKRAERELS